MIDGPLRRHPKVPALILGNGFLSTCPGFGLNKDTLEHTRAHPNTRSALPLPYTDAMRFDSRNSFEIRRFIAMGQDRKTGDGLIHVQGPRGRDITIRVHPSQLRKLADGVMALAIAREARPSD